MSNLMTPSSRLRRALHLRSTKLVKRIILSNAQLPNLLRNVDLDDKANTSLHLAAALGLPDVALFLLEQGHEADAQSRNIDGETPLMLAAAAGPNDADDPVALGRIAVARLLLDAFPDFSPIRDRAGRDAFAHAARAGTHVVLLAMLARAPPTPLVELLPTPPTPGTTPHPFLATRDNEQNTPLHHASAFGHLKSVRVLMTAGADPAAVNAFKWTPLDYAATVAAEVYMRGLLRERDQQQQQHQGKHGRASPVPGRASPAPGRASPAMRLRGDSSEKGRVPPPLTRPIGGVRLVSSDGSGTDEEAVAGVSAGALGGGVGDDASPWQSRARART